ncbi:hypothetical protein Vadar_034411 [Vaccinium darrowii]|uniref:Uncharacterized protein n=1 Tax=Vaccinium darrowii TaxID=229202 RepID=A0ACB7YAU6_9ERIC|nr:hypothetical protein Vadar_034411 [Vaccinium darrowii]
MMRKTRLVKLAPRAFHEDIKMKISPKLGGAIIEEFLWLFLMLSPGVDDNETLKVHRSGGADPDGNRPGDLYVTIKVREDPVFRREGADIHVDADRAVYYDRVHCSVAIFNGELHAQSHSQIHSQNGNGVVAILGGTIQVPTLTGDVVLKVRPGTQPGQKVVLKRKGIKTRNSYTFGDQYVHFNVSIPVVGTKKLDP